MNKPTLTPHTDELEKALLAFFVAIKQDQANPECNSVAAQMTEAILPVVMRAVAYQLDRRVPLPQIAEGLDAAVANSIMSAVGTISGHVDGPLAMINMMSCLTHLSSLIEKRFSDPNAMRMCTTYVYENPDLTPHGNA